MKSATESKYLQGKATKEQAEQNLDEQIIEENFAPIAGAIKESQIDINELFGLILSIEESIQNQNEEK
ncbi:hypothetical protein [Campylobacter sp. RM16188]|uniref:hypothetical protein n=1 Tax=Campylobacter sp. RM16188 TaxID=1705725 RepID=UPI001557104A|nr:hypothetical protein [Campylobacter sp. RM16188]